MTATHDKPASRLPFFPISFFAMVMGMTGLTIAWEKAQSILGLGLAINVGLLAITSLIFVTFLSLYLTKLVRHREAVLNELRHPVKLNFFPTISISLLLLSIAYLHLLPGVSQVLWIMGACLHLAFTLYIVSAWIHHEHFQVHHMNPAWFIPAVGNVLVPVAGVPLGFVSVSWFFFSVGMLFWLILITIIFNRVMFHNPIEARLMPTLFILIAPPAVGFIAYMRLVGGLDPFGYVLYFAGMFLTLLLFTQVGRFLKLSFFLSWWAYSFPLAAFSIASMLMFDMSGLEFYRYLGVGMLMLLSGIIGLLLTVTFRAVASHNICLPGH